MAYFTIKRDRDGYRARLYGANNELVWWTEGYVNKSSAQNAIRIARQTTAATPIRDRA